MCRMVHLVVGVFLLGTWGVQAAQKPNLIVIMCDDLGHADVGFNGCKDIPTPNIDRIAENGVRCTSGYASYSVCGPSRAGFITGRYGQRFGFERNPQHRVDDPNMGVPRDERMIAEVLKPAGYTSGIVGKWHVSTNGDGANSYLKQEFAHFYGFDFAFDDIEAIEKGIEYDKGVNVYTDASIRFIEKNKDHPFFLYLSHKATHGGYTIPEEYSDAYKRKFPEESKNATLFALTEHLDRGLGRTLQAIDDNGLRDNTIVIFMTDNGGAGGRLTGPLRRKKGSSFEAGIRVPMMVRWPGKVQVASVSETPVHIIDLFPTFAAIANAELPEKQPHDGVSLLPVLTQSGKLDRDTLYWYMPHYSGNWGDTPSAVIREGDYKLIWYFGDFYEGFAEENAKPEYTVGERLFLFDLKEDVGEKNNLVRSNPELAIRLKNRLKDWIQECGQELPQANPNFDSENNYGSYALSTAERKAASRNKTWNATEMNRHFMLRMTGDQ